ncbi:MAG: ATP-binding protein [Methanosarcinaceae archaeon]|nr:ATP-binding protein [Methanosarcinaceae archaeon]
MIFKRKIYQKLLEWKTRDRGKKALLIEGARRIGKSTICEEFARNEYKSYILIDFAQMSDDVRDYFLNRLYGNANDLNTFFMLLSATYGVRLYERESLIIFDEVQFFPKAREAIKYLVEDGRYDYLETGSLISIRENVRNILIPSEERRIRMYPMDFEEFAWALGEENLTDYIRQCFTNETMPDRSLHNRAMILFRQYLLIGGMPKVVSLFLENHQNFEECDREKRDILSLYRSDIMKIGSQYRSKVLTIFDSIPGLLSQHEKRIVFKDIAEGSSAVQYEDTFFWLSDSMISNECFLCSDPDVGLALNENRSYVKCYLGDTGLLVSHAFSENELLTEDVYRQILSGKLSMNKGMLYENAIAQMLTSNGHKLYFYRHYNSEKHRADIEIDFLLSNNSKTKYRICPIEVKSGVRYTTTSLERFREKYKKRIEKCYIIHPKNLSVRNGIVCIPPYMVFCL